MAFSCALDTEPVPTATAYRAQTPQLQEKDPREVSGQGLGLLSLPMALHPGWHRGEAVVFLREGGVSTEVQVFLTPA